MNLNSYFFDTLFHRVKDGKIELDESTHQLSLNDFGNEFKHHLHGGVKSFDRLIWNSQIIQDGVTFSMLSPHGSEVQFHIFIQLQSIKLCFWMGRDLIGRYEIVR